MKKLLASVILAVALAGTVPGCQPVAPGSDPVVVWQEQGLQASFDTIDEFLRMEDAYRDEVRAKAPDVHAFAELLRRDAPAVFTAYQDSIEAYKQSRSQADKDAVTAKATQIHDWAATARRYLVDIRKAHGG